MSRTSQTYFLKDYYTLLNTYFEYFPKIHVIIIIIIIIIIMMMIMMMMIN